MSTLEKSTKNICEFVFFRLLLFGGLCAKRPFKKKEEEKIARGFFETNLDLSRHPQKVVWTFPLFFKYLFFIFVFIWVIGE